MIKSIAKFSFNLKIPGSNVSEQKRLEIISIPANNYIGLLLQLVWLVSYLFYVTTEDKYLDKTEQVLVGSGC